MRRPWLAPLTPLYAAGLAWRNLRLKRERESMRRLEWPVISIGNLSTGGSGKTPLAIALAKLLAGRGLRADVLSRGYGRVSLEAAWVDPSGTAEQFGDEPLLIAREAGVPVYVAPQRYDAGRLAEADDAGRQETRVDQRTHAHILDDGFQHRQLFRDVDILLLSSDDLYDGLLPAGNLREPLRALQRATVLAVSADDVELERYLLEPVQIDRNSEAPRWIGPIWRLRRQMHAPHVNGPVYAFCGIARPEQFFAGLEYAGLSVIVRRAFRDHHRYTREDVNRLIAAARATGAAALMTTEKDLVRLGVLASAFPSDLPLKTAHLSVEIEDEAAAIDWLIGRIRSAALQPTV